MSPMTVMDADRSRGAKILPRVTTRAQARAAATARLRRGADPTTAALDADLLLGHALGISKESLYAHLEEPLDGSGEAAYERLVERRAAGEPVSYLRGYKEFFGLRFAVDPRVLVPRPETEVLVEAALAYLRETGRTRVADIGTGSGAVAVAIAHTDQRVRVTATDVSAEALEVASANAQANGVETRLSFLAGDLLEPLAGEIDVVTANLPYLRDDALAELVGERTSLAFEPRIAVVAGPDGLDVIRRAVAQLRPRLAPGGAAFFECDPPQAEAVAELLRRALEGPTRIHPDLAGAPRVVEGRHPGREARASRPKASVA